MEMQVGALSAVESSDNLLWCVPIRFWRIIDTPPPLPNSNDDTHAPLRILLWNFHPGHLRLI